MSYRKENIYFDRDNRSPGREFSYFWEELVKSYKGYEPTYDLAFNNKVDLRIRGKFESRLEFYIQDEVNALFLWGFWFDINTFDVYLNRLYSDEMVVLTNFKYLLERFKAYGISDDSVISALQRYKLTGNLEGLHSALSTAPLLGTSSEGSIIKNYLDKDGDSYTGSSGTFNDFAQEIFYFSRLVYGCSSSFADMYINPDSIVSPSARLTSTMDGAALYKLQKMVGSKEYKSHAEQMTFNFVNSPINKYAQSFTDDDNRYLDLIKKMKINASDIEKEVDTFGFNEYFSEWLYTMTSDTVLQAGVPEEFNKDSVRKANTKELIEMMSKGDDLIYSSNTKKMLEEKGFSKLLNKKEFKDVLRVFPSALELLTDPELKDMPTKASFNSMGIVIAYPTDISHYKQDLLQYTKVVRKIEMTV